MKWLLLLALAAGLSTAEGRKFKPAKLLEYAESPSRLAYFCFEATSPDRLLIGYAPARAGWRSFAGRTMPVSYDDRDILIHRPGGGTLRLTQDYLTRAFVSGSPCEQVIETAHRRLTAPPKTLRTRQVTPVTQSIQP